MSDAAGEIALRLAALDQATRVVASHEANQSDVLALATEMYAWLTTPAPPAHLALTLGAVTTQDETTQETAVQIHDDEQFTLTAQATDAKGYAVTDTSLTWTVDNETVVSLQVSADEQSVTVVAGAPGSAVVTLADTVNNLSVTQAVDVVPAGVATIALTEGTVVKQTPATPAPAPAAPAAGDTTTTPAAPATGTDITAAPVDASTATTAAATSTPNPQMAEAAPAPAAPANENPVGTPAV